jgi:hypothetical protein
VWVSQDKKGPGDPGNPPVQNNRHLQAHVDERGESCQGNRQSCQGHRQSYWCQDEEVVIGISRKALKKLDEKLQEIATLRDMDRVKCRKMVSGCCSFPVKGTFQATKGHVHTPVMMARAYMGLAMTMCAQMPHCCFEQVATFVAMSLLLDIKMLDILYQTTKFIKHDLDL